MEKVCIEITFEKQDGEIGVATHLKGLPDDWDDQEDELSESYMVQLTPEQQFGIMAMNILEIAKPAICEKLGRYASIKAASLQ